LFKKPMKMRDLEVWGVPSYIVDIWEKSYSPHLLPVQEEAVKDYGILDYSKDEWIPACAGMTDCNHPHPCPLPSRARVRRKSESFGPFSYLFG